MYYQKIPLKIRIKRFYEHQFVFLPCFLKAFYFYAFVILVFVLKSLFVNASIFQIDHPDMNVIVLRSHSSDSEVYDFIDKNINRYLYTSYRSSSIFDINVIQLQQSLLHFIPVIQEIQVRKQFFPPILSFTYSEKKLIASVVFSEFENATILPSYAIDVDGNIFYYQELFFDYVDVMKIILSSLSDVDHIISFLQLWELKRDYWGIHDVSIKQLILDQWDESTIILAMSNKEIVVEFGDFMSHVRDKLSSLIVVLDDIRLRKPFQELLIDLSLINNQNRWINRFERLTGSVFVQVGK